MARQTPFNLFVYGTLMSPWVFRAVLGHQLVGTRELADGESSFYPLSAVLNGYTKVSPDDTYLYAVPDRHGRIRGYLIGPLDPACLKALRKYEGKNYVQRTVKVATEEGTKEAVAFLANRDQLEHEFGHEFKDPFKQEVLLDQKIDAALIAAQAEKLTDSTELGRRAMAELHGDTIRDISRRHFEAGGISDYAIRHSLLDTPLPDFATLRENPHAAALAPAYLGMVIRQVIFNEFDRNIRHDLRYELNQLSIGDQCYERSPSMLAALRLINTNPKVATHVREGLETLDFETHSLMDYVCWAVTASQAIYDRSAAAAQVARIGQHLSPGAMPLGAELEFSNIGHNVIRDPHGEMLRDREYDGFLYFYEFALDSLMWKLGGHIDDHHEKGKTAPRRGFLEVALGSLSIEAGLSKPVTTDPWLLNQLIHETCRFLPVNPHSIHLSMQMRNQKSPIHDRGLPLGVMKCLFALGGDPGLDDDGVFRIRRLAGGEIYTHEPVPQLLFADISKRHSQDGDSHALLSTPREGKYVQQYKFLRLMPRLNYELMAAALKGIQITHRPGSFLIADQYLREPKLAKLMDALLVWARAPMPLLEEEAELFLESVYNGLMTEKRGKPAHTGAYIAWCINQLRLRLKHFNATLNSTS
jgi:hypothetical protein